MPTLAEDQKTDSSLGRGFKKVKIDPTPRPGSSTSQRWKAIHQPPPNKTTDMEDLCGSDTESTCSQCSQRGKCSAQDGVCDGEKARPVGETSPYWGGLSFKNNANKNNPNIFGTYLFKNKNKRPSVGLLLVACS